MREQIGRSVSVNAERLEQLEKFKKNSARTIAAATPSVMFLQGSYVFRNQASGQLLRIAVGPDGKPMGGAGGNPRLKLGGEGSVAEKKYTGTGFALSTTGRIVTNRHLALPWESDANLTSLEVQGLKPEFRRFIANLPGRTESFDVELVMASEHGDVAVLKFSGAVPEISGLELASEPLEMGDNVIVMGYPTGLRAMVAQAGKEFMEQVRSSGEGNFWKLAERLVQQGFVQPLASQGIVAKVTQASVVYDADTTRGGSGGPVINSNGRVVGVNAAILPEYGGSNIGVPLAKLQELLTEIDKRKTAATQN